jgi:hypothetical protein
LKKAEKALSLTCFREKSVKEITATGNHMIYWIFVVLLVKM